MHGVRWIGDIADAVAVAAALPGADMVWLETPSNPLIAVADIAAAAARARARMRARGRRHVRDAPAPAAAQLEGADIVVHSATKYLGGHADLLLGIAVCRDPAAAERLVAVRLREGAIPGALEAFLTLRGMRTLAVRLERAQANAGELARRLDRHPAVTRVRYPRLAGRSRPRARGPADERLRGDARVRDDGRRRGRRRRMPPACA